MDRVTAPLPRMDDKMGGYDAVALTSILGPSYQAALGAMALGDAEGMPKPGQSFAEQAVRLWTHDGYPSPTDQQGQPMTEYSITVTDPRINDGAPTNIPSLWEGVVVDEPSAVQKALDSGNEYPAFNTIQEAVTEAQQRSDMLGQQLQPQGFADGGDVQTDPEAYMLENAGPSDYVSPMEFMKGLGQTTYGMGKGATQALIGMPGDVEKFGRVLSGNENPTFLPTSDDVKKTFDKYLPSAGPAVPGLDGRSATEYLGEFLDITPAAAAATKGAKALTKAVAEAAPVSRQWKQAGAVRFPGGTMPSAGFGKEAVSELDTLLNKAKEDIGRLGVAGEKQEALEQFLNTNARDYFAKKYASTNDPIYEALKEGRINPAGSDKNLYRMYMLRAAREGDPEALTDLANRYDMGLRAGVYGPTSSKAALEAKEQLRLLTEASNKTLTPGEVSSKSLENFSSYKMTDEFRKQMTERTAPQHWLTAADKNEVMFDVDKYMIPDFMFPSKVIEELSTLPADKIKNMSYPEAVIFANKNLRFKSDFSEAVARVKQGKAVPKDVMMFGTTPIMQNTDGTTWVKLTDSHAAWMEGTAMGHSVGRYHTDPHSYGLGGREAFNSGKVEVYSLRDKRGNPAVTIEAEPTKEGLNILQIKGHGNEKPDPKSIESVFNFIDKHPSINKLPTENYWNNSGAINWPEAFDEWKRLQ